VLGAEQSGHVAGVGFDLYIRLVGEAVEAFRAAADGTGVPMTEEVREVRVDLPVDAHIPPDYVTSDRLRLEAYRKTASAPDPADLAAVLAELVDRYGRPPEPVENLMAVARLRLLCREHGVTEVAAAGTALRVSPLELADSQQLRLKRLYPSALYKPTSKLIQLPMPRAGAGGIGSGRLRDTDLLQFVADLLVQLGGAAAGAVDVTAVSARVHEKV